MYVPRANVMDPEQLRPLVAEAGSAELVTVSADGFPQATRLPVVWAEDRLVFHMALANPHWRSIADGAPALAVVTGPEAYVSPSWYASKAEHGRVVPTWNYSAIHFTGHATVHRDAAWLEDAVRALTDVHEQRREQPWAVDDAPGSYVAQQLKAIVGIELVVRAVEGKAKLSQNRSDADRAGVVAGLLSEPDGPGRRVAEQMRADLGR